MLNHATIMGRLVRDPELRRTSSGTAVASFTLACDRDYSDKQSGERETDFIDCVAWRSTAEFAARYFTKGRMAIVDGRLQIRSWTDKEGNKRRSAEILADHIYFGDKVNGREADREGGLGHSKEDGTAQPEASQPEFAELTDEDDRLPF